jgi:hypothetical protein
MQTLDSLFKETFLISNKLETSEVDYIYTFKNVFKDPDKVIDFTNRLSIWESDEGSKPGCNTLELPKWTVSYLCDQFVPDEIKYMKHKDVLFNSVRFNYFYYNNKCIYSDAKTLATNNCLLPHCDPTFHFKNWIILINLSKEPITTYFWKFMYENRVESIDEFDHFVEYTGNITEDTYYDVISQGLLAKEFPITYGFNDAILYDGNRIHQPIITRNFTRENPRMTMRLGIRGFDYCNDDNDD